MKCEAGHENPSDSRFCEVCGARIASAAPAAMPRPSAPKVPFSRLALSVRAAIGLAVCGIAGYFHWGQTRPAGWYEQDTGGLYRIRENGRYGYMDRTGKTVIPPQFDDAKDFSEGLAVVKVGRKFGFIDKAGKVVITPQFNQADSFRNGRAGTCDALCGFIDSDGKYVSTPEFRWIGDFSGTRSSDYAPVAFSDGSFGFVSRAGKVEIPGPFEGLSPDGFRGGPAPARIRGHWGFVDRAGKWVIDPQFDMATNFSEGMAAVQVSGKWGYIDSDAKFVVNPQYEAALPFRFGLAPIRIAGKWALIDRKGAIAGDARFLEILGAAANGLRAIKTEDGWGFIDGTKVVIKPQFDGAESFLKDVARVKVGTQDVLIDRTGAWVGDPFHGHDIRPVNAVSELWEGVRTTMPNQRFPEKFLLTRQGNKIQGYSFISPSEPPFGNLIEVQGELAADNSFRVAADNTLVWKGRFVTPITIAGALEGGAGFPFRLNFVRQTAPEDFPPKAPTSSDWNQFLQSFRQAVAQRDATTLAGTLGYQFDGPWRRVRNPADVFRQLNWQQVVKALDEGETREDKSVLGRRTESITDLHPCPNCRYQVMLTFKEDPERQWRWTGIVFPGD